MTDIRAVHRPSRPTMHDVASSAGVSLKTVSRVVNGNDYVSEDKAVRVREAIARLGFRRNEYARSLRAGGTTTIGLVLEDTADPFYSVLVRAVEEVAFERGYMLLTASSAEDPRRSERLISALVGRGVEGLIVAAPASVDAAFLSSEIAAGTSLVLVDRLVPEVEADTVLADNHGGAERGTAQLIGLGHRRIAFLGDDRGVYTASERLAGYLSALRRAGIDADDRLVVMASPHTDAPVERMMHEMLTSADPPTAILSGNNRWSVRLLRALRNRPPGAGEAARERAPRDGPLRDGAPHDGSPQRGNPHDGSLRDGAAVASVARPALIGFDDFELADVLDPGVTVIAQDASAMGRIAGELLFRRLDGDTAPAQRIQLDTTLIRRGSGELPGPFAVDAEAD